MKPPPDVGGGIRFFCQPATIFFVDLSTIKDVSIILAGLIGLIGFISGTAEYIRQRRATRAQHFLDLRRRFLEYPHFRDILNKLATDDPALAQTPIQDRRNLVGFLEEVALMTDSRLVRPEVAHYMFGYYVRLVADSKHFWEGLHPESEYWTLFRSFAARMKHRTPTEGGRVLKF